MRCTTVRLHQVVGFEVTGRQSWGTEKSGIPKACGWWEAARKIVTSWESTNHCRERGGIFTHWNNKYIIPTFNRFSSFVHCTKGSIPEKMINSRTGCLNGVNHVFFGIANDAVKAGDDEIFPGKFAILVTSRSEPFPRKNQKPKTKN